ncbi:rRNA maturation RNase YbeY [Lacibacter luteus]|uniref:Endoribonuclease YbeY n=1 Tax=Lacibacter luteus TaxID=2508719 RepID=A0A4Q1CJ64_9BACT|nr:rRNA maturation RNase YbeY [Lacibacter luteus]RXK60690.1 rRNA maturation RNase YbeY [Lacibacter luteus]
MTTSCVNFFYQDIRFPFTNRNALKSAIRLLFQREKHKLHNLNIIFCKDEALLQINRDFLQHDYYTDIITFPINRSKSGIEAELYISIDRVRDNAKQGAVSFRTELHRVIFHGCLHLVGYNDKSSQQIKKMREREDHYLRLYLK